MLGDDVLFVSYFAPKPQVKDGVFRGLCEITHCSTLPQIQSSAVISSLLINEGC